MNCMNCGIEIPPLWVAALSSNICPSCGKAIMDEHAQDLIKGLAEAMEKMPNNPQGLAGWLVSNYRMQKIGDYEPTEFKTVKKPVNINPNASNSEKLNKTAEFFARAGISMNNQQNKKNTNAKEIDIGGGGGSFAGGGKVDDIDMMMLAGTGEPLPEETMSAIGQAVEEAANAGMSGKGVAMLEAMRMKQEQAQMNIANGIGATSRSGKPAGFRRV